MAEKHIFIGLGGAGVNTITKVKYKIYEKLTASRHKSRLELLDEKYRFLFVDTDFKDISDNNSEYRERYEHGKVDFIDSNKEMIDLGDQNPRVIYEEAKAHPHIQINKRILEACSEKMAATIPNSSLRHGAGAFRIKSRIAFARKSDVFMTRLRTYITEMNSIAEGSTEQNTIYYWVVASSNGGTGSGIVNDVLYYVNMMHKQLINNEDPNVGLLLYMPQFYIDVNSTNERYPKNAFAALSELQAFQCMSKLGDVPVNFHRLSLIRDYHQFDTRKTYRPFSYCIPVDFQTDKNTNMGSIHNMYYNTAELLSYIHSGPGAEGFRSILDNYINEIQTRSSEAFLIPMGYIALRKPEKDFEDYIQLRMRYELIRYGMIGEQINSDGDRKAVLTALFNNILRKNLFDDQSGSIQALFRQISQTKIEEELSDNLIMDSDNKILKKLPSNISNTEADRITLEIEMSILKKSDEIEKFSLQTEDDLWKWVEKHIIEYGLEYVNTALFELDGYCMELYNSFTIDQKGKTAQRKVKQQHIDSIVGELDNLYQKAIEITTMERVTGKNSEDVNRYFQRLKEYVNAKADLMIEEQTYDILRRLCMGDNGVIDRIKRFVSNLLSEAHRTLTEEKGVQYAYEELAKAFLKKSHDVTSVYLPKIQEFAEGYGWKENHQFSQWYAQLIRPTEQYERGRGFVPVRSGGERSLEAFFKAIIAENRQQLLEKGYMNGEHSALFSNSKAGNGKKIIEDILYFAAITLEKQSRNDNTINNEWYGKTLPQFYDELDQEMRKEIKSQLDPCLFFTYNQAKDNNLLTTKNIYVSNNEEIAKEILSYNSGDNNSKYCPGEDPSLIYTLRAKMGLSFDFYRTYDIIKREYDKTASKQEFHFHSAFADCNGDYRNIALPYELEPELITFVQYLLMNGYRNVLAKFYHSSADSFDRENYSSTPILLESTRALIATKRNILQRGENICLMKSDGSRELFASLLFGDAENPFAIMFNKFKAIYIDESLEETIHGLISRLLLDAKGIMETNYDIVRKELINEFNNRWAEANSREEKKMVSEILMALKEELSVFEKFLS